MRRHGDARHLRTFVSHSLAAVGPARGLLGLAAAAALVVGLLEASMLYLVAAVAVALTDGGGEVDLPVIDSDVGVTLGVLLSSALLAVAGLMQLPLARLTATLSAGASKRMRIEIIESYLGSAVEYRATHREGYLTQLLGQYAQRSENATQQLVLALIAISSLAVLAVAGLIVSPLMTAASVALLGLLSLCLRPGIARARQSSVRHATTNLEVVGEMTEAGRLSQEIATYNVMSGVAGALTGRITEAARHLWRVRFDARLIPSLAQYAAIAAVLTMMVTIHAVAPGSLTEAAPMILLLLRSIMYVRQLVTATRTGIELTPYLEQAQAEIGLLRQHPAPHGLTRPRRFTGLSAVKVSFDYPSGPPVLRDLTVEVAPGEMVGVVGPSGSGKSTLGLVLLGLVAPTRGRVEIGGVDLATVDRTALARLLAHVPQSARLRHGSVAENIRFFRPGFEDDAVREAARAAHIENEIEALPQGYETIVGPGANELSGGQRQRLAIARALLGEPELIVLDEPTSALDSHSEKLIGRTLSELKGKTAMVLVAHRPATVDICDRVLEMRSGSLADPEVPPPVTLPEL